VIARASSWVEPVHVDVVYALPGSQSVERVELPEAATVSDALAAVANLAPFSELDLAAMPIGVYGELVAADAPLRDGDRVEIYRPLVTDPKEARRRRAGGG